MGGWVGARSDNLTVDAANAAACDALFASFLGGAASATFGERSATIRAEIQLELVGRHGRHCTVVVLEFETS